MAITEQSGVMTQTNPIPPGQPMTMRHKVSLAIYFAFVGGLLIIGTIALGWGNVAIGSLELRLAIIVAITGGLGAFVHSASSFVTYAGERQLYTSWGWWYVLRPLIGAGLALVFYFTLRGGLFVISVSPDIFKPENINVFGVAAIGGLVGMFSKEATEKLKEVAEGLFKKQPRGDEIKPSDQDQSGGDR